MNRYPYRLPLSLTSLGPSPHGEHLYRVSTVRYSQWEHITRVTRPRWTVALEHPAEAYEPQELFWALQMATPMKYLTTLNCREQDEPGD